MKATLFLSWNTKLGQRRVSFLIFEVVNKKINYCFINPNKGSMTLLDHLSQPPEGKCDYLILLIRHSSEMILRR